jgi:hypothetical protein
METKIKKIQTAIFTKNFNISNDLDRANLLTEINKSVKHVFNGVPTQLPIPNDAPPEIPRFILKSIDENFSCNIALSRIDILYNVPVNYSESKDELFETQKKNTEVIFDFLLNKNIIIINRIGFIAVTEKTLISEEKDSINYLRSEFIKNDKFSSPKELLFRYNQEENSDNFDMNNLITISAKIGSSINLQTDINTIAEKMDENNFTKNNFGEIIDYAILKTKKFIDNFPNI